MDDLTIIKACAEAMNLPEIQPYKGTKIGYRCRPGEHEWLAKYDPLTDDAQAMALVNRAWLARRSGNSGTQERWMVCGAGNAHLETPRLKPHPKKAA